MRASLKQGQPFSARAARRARLPFGASSVVAVALLLVVSVRAAAPVAVPVPVVVVLVRGPVVDGFAVPSPVFAAPEAPGLAAPASPAPDEAGARPALSVAPGVVCVVCANTPLTANANEPAANASVSFLIVLSPDRWLLRSADACWDSRTRTLWVATHMPERPASGHADGLRVFPVLGLRQGALFDNVRSTM